LRGVTTHATADYSIYFPTNTGPPPLFQGPRYRRQHLSLQLHHAVL